MRPAFTIAAELTRSSPSFENVLRGAPMKQEDGAGSSVRYFLSSDFTSGQACAFIDGRFEGGKRRDDTLRVRAHK